MANSTELRTERLPLRPFQVADTDDVLAYADDAEWSHFLYDIPKPYTRESAQGMVAGAQLTDWDVYPIFAVVRDGHVIGRVSADISTRHKTAELGCDRSEPRNASS